MALHSLGVRLCRASQLPLSGLRGFRKKPPPEVRLQPSNSLETPFSAPNLASTPMSYHQLLKPLLFTIGFSGTTYVACSLWEYESMRAHAIRQIRRQPQQTSRKWQLELRKHWDKLTPGQKVFVPICVANVAVFLAWKIPKFQPIMLRYFATNPANKYKCMPMLLSTFSHYSAMHLAANMYVLHSFSTGAVHSLGQEQFIGLYLSSGVIASLASYLYKVARCQAGLSLGASGSIMAILAYVCIQHPDTQLGIILLPLFTFSAGAAIKFIVGLDMVGVAMGWRFFDHAAHLGGALSGVSWALWGAQGAWPHREPIVRYWHQLRGNIK